MSALIQLEGENFLFCKIIFLEIEIFFSDEEVATVNVEDFTI